MARRRDKTLRLLGERLAERYRGQVEEELPQQLSQLIDKLREKERIARAQAQQVFPEPDANLG